MYCTGVLPGVILFPRVKDHAPKNASAFFRFFLLITSVSLCLLGLILSRFGAVCALVGMVLSLLSYGVLFWYALRAFSRDLDKRSRENRRFLTLKSRITDRKNRYFRCPNCSQTVRVPRGRGKICIRCPKCSEKFIRKS